MATAGRVYEQFKPSSEWIHEDACDTLVLDLPGFMKKNLRVQVTSHGKLRVSGERQLGGNKWDHFLEEFPIASNCDMNKITARFESNKLHIRLPKEITSDAPQNEIAEKPTEPTKPKPMNETESAKNHEQKTNQENASKVTPDNTMPKLRNEEAKADDIHQKGSGKELHKETRHENESGKLIEKYKQAAGGMVPQLRRPKVVNVILVVCSVMILGFYVRNVYRSFGPSKDE